MKTFFHPMTNHLYFSNIIKIQMKKINGIPTGSQSLEHIESGNLFCFVYLRPEEIMDSASLALQKTNKSS